MEPTGAPTPPEKSALSLLGKVVLLNFLAALVLSSIGGPVGLLALPVLNLVVGAVLLFTVHRKLGIILLLSGLAVALLGLGTCALLLSGLQISGH